MKLSRFAIYSWVVLTYNLAVILWGAYVRASGSGAGCGSHWPLCNGEVIPRAPRIETLIELAHRLTSGLSLILIVVLAVWAFRAYPKGHHLRLGTSLAVLFLITEALVGAGLVLFELVATNASVARALFMSVHLTNTFMLLAALTLTAWWALGGLPPRLREQGSFGWIFAVGLLGTLILGVSGAVTALGDTLFPATSLAEGLKQDFSSTAHLLIRLRLLHPAIAITVSCYLVIAAGVACFLKPENWLRRFSLILAALILIQLGVGLLNVTLLAPIRLQLTHLLLADLMWISLVLLTNTVLAKKVRQGELVERPGLRPALKV